MNNFKNKKIVTLFLLALTAAVAVPMIIMAQRDYNYDRRGLKSSVNDLKNRTEKLTDHIDSYLDRSIYNSSNREDRVNEMAQNFRSAADRLKDNLGDANERDLDRTSGDAYAVLELGDKLENFFSRTGDRVDNRIRNDWSGIRQDLRVISQVYGSDGFTSGRSDQNPFRNKKRAWPW